MDTVPIQQLGRRLLRLSPERQLAAWMAAHGINQGDLAELVGADRTFLGRVIRGEGTSAPLVDRIRELTGVDLGRGPGNG